MRAGTAATGFPADCQREAPSLRRLTLGFAIYGSFPSRSTIDAS